MLGKLAAVAELEVQSEAVVDAPLPEGGDAVVVGLRDDEGHALLPEHLGQDDARRPGAEDDGPVHPPAPRGGEAVRSIKFTRDEEHHR